MNKLNFRLFYQRISVSLFIENRLQNFVANREPFCDICNEHYPVATELSEDIVLGWLQTHPDEVNVLNQRASCIRMLGKYIISTGKIAYILPEKFISPQKSYVPYIL